jgi:hypothetical protein
MPLYIVYITVNTGIGILYTGDAAEAQLLYAEAGTTGIFPLSRGITLILRTPPLSGLKFSLKFGINFKDCIIMIQSHSHFDTLLIFVN